MTTLTLIPRLDAPVTNAPLTALITFERKPAMVTEARIWLRKLLAEWAVTEDAIDDAVIMLSETFTNSIIHAMGIASDATITAAMWDGRLQVSVSDPDPVVYPGGPGDSGEHGRGLEIVKALAVRFGTTPMSQGKIVFFELLIGGAL